MISQPTLSEPRATEALTPDTQYYHDVLHELIGMGLNLARIVHTEAQASAAAEVVGASIDPAPDPTIAFDRIARTVRRSIALARSLAHPPPAYAADNTAAHRVAARKLILRGVEDAIERHAGADADTLHGELLDRLDTADLDDDIAARPVAEIMADICRDLGVDGPRSEQIWKRRSQADVAELHARAARPHPAMAVQAGVAVLPRRSCNDPDEDGMTALLYQARFRGK